MKNSLRFALPCIFLLALGCKNVVQVPNGTSNPRSSSQQVPPSTAQEIAVLERFLGKHPNDPAALFNLALDQATIRQREKALSLLEQMAKAHTGMDPKAPAGQPFRSFASDPRFLALVNEIEKENPPIVGSKRAFLITERDLAPEGIAYDPVEKKFYLSSVSKRKIVSVSSDGSVRDFKSSGQDGLGSTLGMKVDAKRRMLWVVSVASPANPKKSPSAVFQYDLKTGALLHKHQLPPGASGFLNDVGLSSSGAAFTTNTGTGEVFRILPNHEGLKPFLLVGSVPQANGTTLSGDEKLLFVAGWLGIVRVDLATKHFHLLAKPPQISDASLDGMYFYQGSLVGIQNPDVHPGRIVRYFLNPTMGTITRAEVLETYNPRFDVPTTATIVGDSLYFVANTQVTKLREDNSMPPPNELQDVEVVKLKL